MVARVPRPLWGWGTDATAETARPLPVAFTNKFGSLPQEQAGCLAVKKDMSSSRDQKQIEAKIEERVRRIVDGFGPERIILFGSFANGTADADSDVDFLVVIRVTTSKRKHAAEIDLALADVGLPKDVIVVTPEEVEKYRDVVGSIIYPALREGKVLYERAA